MSSATEQWPLPYILLMSFVCWFSPCRVPKQLTDRYQVHMRNLRRRICTHDISHICIWCRNTQFLIKPSWIWFDIMQHLGPCWSFKQSLPGNGGLLQFSASVSPSLKASVWSVFQNMLGKARPKSLQLGESRLTLLQTSSLQQAMPLSPPPITPKTPRTQSELCSLLPFKQNLWDFFFLGGGSYCLDPVSRYSFVQWVTSRKDLLSCFLRNGEG